MISFETIRWLLPEIVLVFTASWIYLYGAFSESRRGLTWCAASGLAVAAYILIAQWDVVGEAQQLSMGSVVFDPFGHMVRALSVLIAALLVAAGARGGDERLKPESLGSLLLIATGLMLVASAAELSLIFLGLELISIPTYILLFLGRRDQSSQEATLKYFFLSILSSAVLLYGFSFLYGLSGSTRLPEMYRSLEGEATAALFPSLAPMAFVLIVAGLSFKIAAAPFHFYAPDVYQGTTNLNAGLLAVIPKVAGIVALVRIGAAAMPAIADVGWQACLVLSLLTMTLGNVVALWQRNLRRLMAYSSIAHAGYMLIGISVWMAASAAGDVSEAVASNGVSATLFYLSVYAAASLGTFAALVHLSGGGRQLNDLDELSGLCRTNRGAALMIALFMFSLAGLPPLAGFWGKLSLFANALNVQSIQPGVFGAADMRTWFLVLAIVGVLNAAISAGYYLRVVATIYFAAPAAGQPLRGQGIGSGLASGFCATMVIALGLFPGPLVEWMQVSGSAAAAVSESNEQVEIEAQSPLSDSH